MPFNDETIRALNAPLSSENVKQRPQAGRKLSYVESWHAIAEANRIFGFGGWTRETVELKCVSERERMDRNNPTSKWDVTYVAKVRVTVHGVTREGSGAGHGLNMTLGDAHESALKEAESDAMKRALMTFGNPFGLALYDKEQRNVDDGSGAAAPAPKAKAPPKAAPDDTKAPMRKFLAGTNYHLPMMTTDGRPRPDVWVVKFTALLPLTGDAKQIDKLATENGATLAWLAENEKELSARVTKALQDQQRAVQDMRPLAAAE